MHRRYKHFAAQRSNFRIHSSDQYSQRLGINLTAHLLALIVSTAIAIFPVVAFGQSSTTVEENEPINPSSEGNDRVDILDCSINPFIALALKVTPSVLAEVVALHDQEMRLAPFRNSPYSQVTCTDETSVGSRMLEAEARVLSGLSHLRPSDIAPDSTQPALATTFSSITVLSTFCENPRRAELLSLRDTPACRRAAEYMEATGMGSDILGVREDSTMLSELRRAIRVEIQQNGPISAGGPGYWVRTAWKAVEFVETVLGIDGYFSDAQDQAETARLNQESRTNKAEALDNINSRLSEINSDLRVINAVKSEGGGDDLLSIGVVVSLISPASLERARKDEGANTIDQVEVSVRAEKSELEIERRRTEAEIQDLDVRTGCEKDDGCDFVCVGEECVEDALEFALDPVRQSIESCEAETRVLGAVRFPGGSGEPIGQPQSIFESAMPVCTVTFNDDPCFSLSPDGCEEQGAASEDQRFRRENSLRTGSNLHCLADDIACNQTATALIGLAAGVRPSGLVHESICNQGAMIPADIGAPRTDSVTPEAVLDGTSAPASGDCEIFMGIEICGAKRSCFDQASDKILPSPTLLESSLILGSRQDYQNLGGLYFFLLENESCRMFEEDLRSYWLQYADYLRDFDIMLSLGSEDLKRMRPFNYGVTSLIPSLEYYRLTYEDALSANDSSKVGRQPPGIIGSEDYYVSNFCQ